MRIPIQSVTPDTGHAEVCGWVHEERDLGGLAFFLIRNRTGIIQVTIPKKKVSEAVLDAAKKVSRESVVRIAGTVKAVEKAPGGREIVPDWFEIISLAETPLPLDVSEKVGAELDTRLRCPFPRCAPAPGSRSLPDPERCDARGPQFLPQGRLHQHHHPEDRGRRNRGRHRIFPIAYFDKEAFLNQSPQLYKQMMMAGGFEKVCEIGPIFRAEEHNTTKHLNEATSIDIEVWYADHNEVMKILEDLIVKIYEYVNRSCSDQLANLECTDFAVPKGPVHTAALQ